MSSSTSRTCPGRREDGPWGQHPQRLLPGRRWGQTECGGSQQFDNLESEAEARIVSDELRDSRGQILEGPVWLMKLPGLHGRHWGCSRGMSVRSAS